MPDLRFELCKITADCPACLEVDVTTFPIATSYILYQPGKGTSARLQYVRGDISGKGEPLSCLDPALLFEQYLEMPDKPPTWPRFIYFEIKLSWISAHLGAGSFKIYLFGKAGTIVRGRLLVP